MVIQGLWAESECCQGSGDAQPGDGVSLVNLTVSRGARLQCRADDPCYEVCFNSCDKEYSSTTMSESQNVPPERRRHERITLDGGRIRLVSGEYDDLTSGVNFARRLINVSLGGMCVETTGRLRAGVIMSTELRFDDFGGSLRTKAQFIWVETVKDGDAETHLAGLQFIGPEMTTTVREFLDGVRASTIFRKRHAEYKILKQLSQERKGTTARKGWSTRKTVMVTCLVIALVYLAGFVAAVLTGRRDTSGSGVHFRYAGRESKGGVLEKALARLYSPLYGAALKAGLDLRYDPP